jgi:hypothetical protein
VTAEMIEEIFFPELKFEELVAHARRKLSGNYLPAEEPEPKAYGLVGARLSAHAAHVTHVVPLVRNLRYRPDVKAHVDVVMKELAIPSETPLERRGWVADPREVLEAELFFDQVGVSLLGSYHVHRVAWTHDADRQTCTEVDARLAKGSALWVFILSMVDPARPVLRAFFEGRNELEAPLRLGTAPNTVRPPS